jgi:hypothetical protein
MGKVFSHMTMSLDGYIAEPDDQVGELFEWYEAGDVTVPNPNENVLFKVDDASAELLRDLTENTGALIAAGTCSTSPMVGTTSTRSTHSSSSSRIARRRMPPKNGRLRRSSTESRRRSLGRSRSPATRNVTIASANVIPAQDMKDLRGKTALVRGWVNKAVAHADATGREAPPLSEIHTCVDVVFDLFNKYGQLIRGVTTDNDVVMSPWARVFRMQWIPDDQWKEIFIKVDRGDFEP